jgi:hypothetical protein
MKTIPFALAAVAVLGACSMLSPPPGNTTPNIVTNVNTLRPGTGVVQTVTPTPGTSITAGSGSSEPLQRLEIKMSDGRLQYIDTPSREIAKGDRVQLSSDNVIRRI